MNSDGQEKNAVACGNLRGWLGRVLYIDSCGGFWAKPDAD
jgi:hypothetical protein